jgi:hypothetical protein
VGDSLDVPMGHFLAQMATCPGGRRSGPAPVPEFSFERVQIVVDDRERPSGVLAELEKLEGAIVRIEHLVVGDYCIDAHALFASLRILSMNWSPFSTNCLLCHQSAETPSI